MAIVDISKSAAEETAHEIGGGATAFTLYSHRRQGRLSHRWRQYMAEQSANRPLTSKAVTYKSLGGYEVIEFVERMVRAPAAGEVRIEAKAAGESDRHPFPRSGLWQSDFTYRAGHGCRRSHRICRARRIAPTSRPEGDSGSQSSAPRRRRAGAAHRGARCLGRSDT